LYAVVVCVSIKIGKCRRAWMVALYSFSPTITVANKLPGLFGEYFNDEFYDELGIEIGGKL